MSTVDFDVDPETRRRMQSVRTEDTAPERVVQAVLRDLGHRFTVQRKDLPGKPDIVLPERSAVLLVHGCFWHGHESCDKGTRRPRHNAAFWESKIRYNKAKDLRVSNELEKLGWRVIVVWECECRHRMQLKNRLEKELGSE